MSIKIEKTEQKNEVKLEFSVEAEKFVDAIKKVYAKSAKLIAIPGFRKGKAPMNIVEKYYGKEIFYEDAFNEVVPEIYEKELKENNIEAVSNPKIDIIQMEKGKDLIFTAIVQTKPEVKLGKYKGIEVEKVEYNVTDEDIKKELEKMAEKNARIISVDDRAVEDGDITVIDFEGFVDGKAFEGGKAEKHELTIGSKTFIPGFEDQIIGMKIDEEKDVLVTFPEQYFSEELAGKDATFKVKLHEIKKKELPAIDDELAKDVSEFDTLKELEASIKDRLEKENESRAKFENEDAVVKAVTENTEIDIPSGMIEREIENNVKDVENRLKYQGATLNQYLNMMGKTLEDFKEEYKPQAQNVVKQRLVLEAVAKEEKIEPTVEEINAKIKEMAENYGRKEEEMINNEQLKEYITANLKVDKTIEFLTSNAKFTTKK